MDVDEATSSVQTPSKHPAPELEVYCYLLVLIFLIDQKRYDEVFALLKTSPVFVLVIEIKFISYYSLFLTG